MDLAFLDSPRRRARMLFEKTASAAKLACGALFAEHHVFVRTRRHVRGFVVTPRQQMVVAAVMTGLGAWTVGATLAASHEASLVHHRDHAVERQASAAIALAAQVEARQAALAHLIATAAPAEAGAAGQAATPAPGAGDPLARIAAVGAAESRAIDAADALARLRAEQYRRVLRAAGLSPARLPGGEGGPLIRPGDPIARLARSDEAFFAKAARAAASLADAGRLAVVARSMPLGRPIAGALESSGFGLRSDPFTGEAAFHAGQDFAAPMYTPVTATGGGVVSFTGERNGYGNAVEVTHAGGLMTRYGHLAVIRARLGERIAAGQVIGEVGSTGRSTGPHLHYEVWLDGRAENPMRFVHAGDQLAAR